MKIAWSTILIFGTLSKIVHASSGDRSTDFVQCLDLCRTERCGIGSTYVGSLALRLMRWTCTDDCKYQCMHQITERDLQRGKPTQQYYGKWPFWRFAGMQEPASVAFSLFNLWAHARGASKIRRRVSKEHPMRHYYLAWSVISVNAWVCSSVFHTRDLPLTEKMDYFAAALAIMYALYYTTIRLFHLYSQTPRLTLAVRPANTLKRRILATSCILSYIFHISYLSLLPRFDYTYNMAFNLVLGLAHNALWALYSLPTSIPLLKRFLSRPQAYRPHFAGKAAVFVTLTTAATALELFDFPPWGGVIDAHALWHLATAPIAYYWYDFLVEDSLDPSWREQRA